MGDRHPIGADGSWDLGKILIEASVLSGQQALIGNEVLQLYD